MVDFYKKRASAHGATVSYWFTVWVCASHLMRYLVCESDWMGFDGQKKSPLDGLGGYLCRWELNISTTWASWSCLSKILSTGISTESTV